MKKRLTKLVALALALVMLTGCGLPGFDFGGGTDAEHPVDLAGHSFGGVTSTNTFVTARVYTAGINITF